MLHNDRYASSLTCNQLFFSNWCLMLKRLSTEITFQLLERFMRKWRTEGRIQSVSYLFVCTLLLNKLTPRSIWLGLHFYIYFAQINTSKIHHADRSRRERGTWLVLIEVWIFSPYEVKSDTKSRQGKDWSWMSRHKQSASACLPPEDVNRMKWN